MSELLRERLGPTSEYTSSLIAIEAAYINTNHPAFVAGTASAARESTPQNRKRVLDVPHQVRTGKNMRLRPSIDAMLRMAQLKMGGLS